MIINESTYENYFLLYIDNELTAEEKAAVDAFIVNNPSYAPLFESLLASCLPAEFIQYEDKALLYRFEEMEQNIPVHIKQSLYRNKATIIKISFVQRHFASLLSVAALFILLVGYQVYQNKHTSNFGNDGKASFSKLSKEIPTGENTVNSFAETTDATKDKTIGETREVALALQNKDAANNATLTSQVPTSLLNAVAGNNHSIPSNNATQVLGSIINTHAVQDAHTIQDAIAINDAPTNQELHANKDVHASQAIATSNNTEVAAAESVQQTYNEIDTDPSDRIIYISNIEVDSDKLRGITRRMGALFRKNKTEKDK
jgi:hypothetical protein